MSTEHQRYSADNQAAAIELYAAAHGLAVVRTYADLGRSGLTLSGRPGLQQLLSDVAVGVKNFEAILVYDVSRWGRFQDPDESAAYELACRRAGIAVHYCAELFENDGGLVGTILKSIKRVMAAEYSRELSEKVSAAHRRGVAQGYLQSGWAPLGLSRLMIDAAGRPIHVLERGEATVRGARIVYVHGPRAEVELVRRIFRMYGRLGWSMTRIARTLNAEGRHNPQAGPWSYSSIRNVLRSEAYIGNNVYGRKTSKLGAPTRAVPAEQWARADGVFEPMVPRRVFNDVAARLAALRRPNEADMLAQLSGLLSTEGRLSSTLIDAAPRMASAATYAKHFGGLARAYALVGYAPSEADRVSDHLRAARFERDRLFGEVVAALGESALPCEFVAARGRSIIDGKHVLQLRVIRPRIIPGRAWFWLVNDGQRVRPALTLIARMGPQGNEPQDYWLATVASFRGRETLRLTQRTTAGPDLDIFQSLEGLGERCRRLLDFPSPAKPATLSTSTTSA